jgi:large subunit ribosomal protein L18Ae
MHLCTSLLYLQTNSLLLRLGVSPSRAQIIKTATVPASACKRANTLQFHDSKIKFPLTRRLARPSAPEFRTLYKATRPSVAMI